MPTTVTRTIFVLAPTPADAIRAVEAEPWGEGVTVLWAGDPDELVALGLPEGQHLYDITSVIKFEGSTHEA
jgi:hypothetical protein